MKKLVRTSLATLALLLAIALVVFLRLQPIREWNNVRSYNGTLSFKTPRRDYNESKKTVLIVADNNGTEMFDMMAPYYLFSATGKANVYLVAEKQDPITMKKGPYVLPHFTFRDIDSMKMHIDVIVIPYMNDPAGATKVGWIKSHYSDSTIILAICDGAWTAAATGIYDGKLLTAHATDFEGIKKKFSRPIWVQQTSFTRSGNLFSTAGVSNAVEGSLAVIDQLFGQETMKAVLRNINYYKEDIQSEHKSLVVNTKATFSALMKMIFKKNKRVGVLLQDGINEFDLAGVFDSYNRTLPSCISAFTTTGNGVTSKYGLTLIPNEDMHFAKIDEMHVVNPESISNADLMQLKNFQVVTYHHSDGHYIINECLSRIERQYGANFQALVKRALDYN
jgi:putative intracellular protease/amidase